MSASISPLSSDASGRLAELLMSAAEQLSTTPSGPDLAPAGIPVRGGAAAGPGADAAFVGRLLDFLRQRAGAEPSTLDGLVRVTLTDAVATYDAGALALTARGTQHTYRTCDRRLVAEFGDRDPQTITVGDLTDLIAKHVLAMRSSDDRRRVGRVSEENAVGVCRHLWSYLDEKGSVGF